MKYIVITGSTHGIGFGLAEAFLALDCAVTISGRTAAAIQQAVERLTAKYETSRIFGCACDVTDPDQVRRLWEQAKAHFGQVDIWINNAGISHPTQKAWDQPPGVVKNVIETNLLGTMYGSIVAMQGMLTQGFGSLYNMEGMGADGRRHAGMSYYGSSKYSVHYFTQSLIEETRNTPVRVASLRPGMMATELITQQFENRPEEWRRFAPIFNTLAERVEIVAAWLARRILENDKHGVCLQFTSPWKLFWRFLTARFRNNSPHSFSTRTPRK